MEEVTKQPKEDATPYSGSGWSLASLRSLSTLPESVTAPLTAAGIIVAVVLFGIGILLIWRLIELTWSGTADEAIRAASAALTAIAAIFGAAFIFWRTLVAHWQARASQEIAVVSRESHYTSLFTKAVEQLGATREVTEIKEKPRPLPEMGLPPIYEEVTETKPNLEVRLGAIYALERIAHDSERDHWPIMEVLCAYIRENAKEPTAIETSVTNTDTLTRINDKYGKIKQEVVRLPSLQSDIQAAITVIGRRSAVRRQLELARSMDVNFPGEYRLDLRGANLQRVDLRGLHFDRALFDKASLDGAQMNSGRFNGAWFFGTSLKGVHAIKAEFDDAVFDDAHLEATIFQRVSAKRAYFSNAIFARSDLRRADFSGSHFDDCILVGAIAQRATFSEVGIYKSNLALAMLERVRFDKAEIFDSSVDAADFDLTVLYQCDLESARELSSRQVEAAFEGDLGTKLPQNILRPVRWPNRVLTAAEITSQIELRDKAARKSN